MESSASPSPFKMSRSSAQKPPHISSCRHEYTLQFTPWFDCVSALKKRLKIVSQKSNKSIYDLSLEERSRHLAARLLNELMEEYRKMLKQERDQMAAEQLLYLEQRQAQIYAKLETIFNEHTSYLKGIVHSKGFIGLEEELESYIKPHEELRSKIFEIDVELGLLESQTLASAAPENLKDSLKNIEQLEQQRDLYQLALQEKNSSPAIYCARPQTEGFGLCETKPN